MIGVRVMPGLENLEGRTFGTLRIGRMVERHPQPRYSTTCSLCSAQSTETNSRLVNGTARCRNGGCGKPQRSSGRELLAEQRRHAAEREARRRAEDLEASELRMAAEVEFDHPKPTTERETVDEQSVEQRREQQRLKKQRAYWADWVLNDRDPQLQVSAAMRSASMPQAEADIFNDSEIAKFTDTKEYGEYKTVENTGRILAYLHLNGIKIVDVETLQTAFVRLRDLDILEKKPEPPHVEPPPTENVTPEPQERIGPKVYIGRDYTTGRDREFTQREVDRMSSREYARAFEVIPTIAEWLTETRKSDK